MVNKERIIIERFVKTGDPVEQQGINPLVQIDSLLNQLAKLYREQSQAIARHDLFAIDSLHQKIASLRTLLQQF